MPGDRLPRDKDELLREVDVRMRIGDIRRMHEMRERLAPRWWEPALIVILFAAALGLLASLMVFTKFHDDPSNKWLLFWLGLLILTSVMCFQVILIRIYQFRRANDLLTRMAEDHARRLDAMENRHSKEDKKAEAEAAPTAKT